MRNSLDLGGGAHGLIGSETALGVDQVGCEDGVDESRFAQASLSYTQWRVSQWPQNKAKSS